MPTRQIIDWPCTCCGHFTEADVNVPLSQQTCSTCAAPLVAPRRTGRLRPVQKAAGRPRKTALEELGRKPAPMRDDGDLEILTDDDGEASARESARFLTGDRWRRRHQCPVCGNDVARDLRQTADAAVCAGCRSPRTGLSLPLSRHLAVAAAGEPPTASAAFRIELAPRSIALLAAIPTVLLGALLVFTTRWSGDTTNAARARSEDLVTRTHRQLACTDAVNAVARGFVQASTPAEMASFTREGARSIDAIAAWIADGHPIPLRWQVRYTPPADELGDDGPCTVATVDEVGAVHTIPVLATADGPKVDFRAIAALGDMSLASFCQRTPSTPVVLRLKFWRDDYFNHSFADPREWFAFRVIDPALKAPLYAYGSTRKPVLAAAALTVPPIHSSLPRHSGSQRAPYYLRQPCAQWTVRARVPDPLHADQIEITELIAESWTDSSTGLPPESVSR